MAAAEGIKQTFTLATMLSGAVTLGACAHTQATYPHANEPIGSVTQVYDGSLTPDQSVNTFRNIDRLFPTRLVPRSANPYPLPPSDKKLTNVKFVSDGKHYDLVDFLSRNRVTGLMILKDGKVVSEIYQNGNGPQTRWMSMSVAKSVTSTLIGFAIKDGYIHDVNDPVTRYVPRLKGTAYEGVTIKNVIMMASGVKWDETYTNPQSDRRNLLRAQVGQQPGSLMDVMASLPRAQPAGSIFNYDTGETQVAGEIVIGATKKNLSDYLEEKLWSRYGMEADANWWLDSPNGHEIAGSGFSATLRDYARIGLFVMNDGMIGANKTLPDGWVAEATTPKTLSTGKLNPQYGYFWWVPTSGPSVADKAFYANGIFGQSIYVDPKEKVVIAVWSAQSKPTGAAVIKNIDFYDAVVAALH
jgi:CubicO group peptidase (beta-lactamase class C family)